MKLPKPPLDDGTRPEFEEFMNGCAFILLGVKRAFPNFETGEIWKSAWDVANEMWPPFDHLPSPVKRGEDGNRRDGFVMSED